MRGVMKAFNLVQLAFWFHQIIVINIEERRNDHWQMLVHHFITVSLIWGSYCYSHTRVGNLILILMDQGDLLLSVRRIRLECYGCSHKRTSVLTRLRLPSASATSAIPISVTSPSGCSCSRG